MIKEVKLNWGSLTIIYNFRGLVSVGVMRTRCTHDFLRSIYERYPRSRNTYQTPEFTNHTEPEIVLGIAANQSYL